MKTLIQTVSLVAGLILAAGCATPVPMSSIESTAKRPATLNAGSRIAILPIAARVGGQRYLASLSAAQEVYLERVGATTGIKAGRDIEKKFSEQGNLTAAYQAILEKLLDRDPNLCVAQEDILTTLDSKPWNGQSGIKYEKLSDINTLVAGKATQRGSAAAPAANAVAREIRLQWNVRTKAKASYEPLPLASVKELSQALECDYVLIPVVRDSYNYVKQWFAFTIIPVFRTTGVYRMNDMAFYLVDGASGEVVQALQITENRAPQAASNDALVMVLALNKMIQKGDSFGSFTFR